MQRNSPPPGADFALRQTIVYPHGGAGRALAPRIIHRPVLPREREHEPRAREEREHEPRGHQRGHGHEHAHEPRGSWSESPRHGIVPGTIIGNYRVLEPLATGGMGVVYLGEHVHLGRKVALKFLRERLLGDSWAVSRFFAEAVAAARITHPGAVSVFDYGTFEGGAYLVMEYLRGETLSARLERERPLPLAAVLDIGVQLGLTLAAAHDAGVIHRDLKPENIHLVPDPSGSGYEYVKILDFGVAKLTAVSHCCPQTQRGDLLGTPHYMAPEQSVHAGSVDHRCDIYSLGCLLYQLLTGLPPFRGSLMEILLSHQNDTAPSPRAYDPWVPPALDSLVRRMMSKSPEGRPASMVEVVRALSAIEREEGACRAQGPTRRRSAAWLGLFFGVGLTIAGLGHLATIW